MRPGKDPKTKSAHLQQLEDVFERHTRRFSPFVVLGLRPDDAAEAVADPPLDPEPPRASRLEASSATSPPLPRITPGSHGPTPGSHGPTHGSHGPTHGSHGPTTHTEGSGAVHSPLSRVPPGSLRPTPGVGLPSPLVVVVKNTTTGDPGVGQTHPPLLLPRLYPGAAPDVASTPAMSPTPAPHPPGDPLGNPDEVASLPMPEVLAAARLGSQLGPKVRRVLAYLNDLRTLDAAAYTRPVGYGQLSAATGVDPDYLRRKALPKLARLGLLGIACKSLDGTIYHLPQSAAYLRVVADEAGCPARPAAIPPAPVGTEEAAPPLALPAWLDRERWSWLSPETLRQLVAKAGSEAQAQEKLDILVSNETHGAPEQRVRHRRSVLEHYLTHPQAEIWPNDQGYETLAMRQARWERDRARQEQALAEEALRARQEAAYAQFCATLAAAQWRWVQREAKRRVDARPEATFLQSRYRLYKAEEDQLLREWMDRVAYGETVPHLDEAPASEPR